MNPTNKGGELGCYGRDYLCQSGLWYFVLFFL